MRYDLSNAYKSQCAGEYLKELAVKKAIIELKEVKPKRSLDANALLWLWLTCIEVETGMKKEETHLLYRALFLPREDEEVLQIVRGDTWETIKRMVNGFQYFKELPIIADIISRSTTSLDTAEFSRYLTSIRNHARTNLNVILLTLQDKNFRDFYNTYGFR